MRKEIILAAALLAAAAGPKAFGDESKGSDAKDAQAADQSDGEKKYAWDNGQDTIDVSAYPKEQQDNYAVFAEKCSKCHTLARPINSPYALPEEWTAYVDKMQHKKRSGIDADSAKQITSFLIYDSSVRKKELITQKQKDKDKAAPQTDTKDTSAKDGGAPKTDKGN